MNQKESPFYHITSIKGQILKKIILFYGEINTIHETPVYIKEL